MLLDGQLSQAAVQQQPQTRPDLPVKINIQILGAESVAGRKDRSTVWGSESLPGGSYLTCGIEVRISLGNIGQFFLSVSE